MVESSLESSKQKTPSHPSPNMSIIVHQRRYQIRVALPYLPNRNPHLLTTALPLLLRHSLIPRHQPIPNPISIPKKPSRNPLSTPTTSPLKTTPVEVVATNPPQLAVPGQVAKNQVLDIAGERKHLRRPLRRGQPWRRGEPSGGAERAGACVGEVGFVLDC